MNLASSPMPDKVSVVVPAWRAAGTVARAVNSVLAEAVVAEVIVVLDGPDAGLRAAVPDDPRVRLIELPRTQGAPVARNTGLAAATSEFVLFLDADDFVEDNSIGALANAARDADLAFGPYAFAFPSGRRIRVEVTTSIGQPAVVNVLKAWFGGHYVPCCAVLWRTSFVRALGGWKEDLMKNQDGELVWRACRAGPRLALAASGLGVYMQSLSTRRVSGNRTRAMYEQQLALLARIEDDLPRDLLADVSAELGGMYYRLARTAYYDGFGEPGVSAERAAWRLGVGDHGGTRGHRIAATMLGLRRKEWLCGKLHRVRHAFGLMRPAPDLAPVER